MSTEKDKPKRRLKLKYRLKKKIHTSPIVKWRQKAQQLQQRVKALEGKLTGGFLSPDGKFCDTKYAARYIGKSESTLRNMLSQGVGPKAHRKSGSVYYLMDDLKAYVLEGISIRHDKE